MLYTALDNGKVKYIGNNINESKIIDYSKVEYNLLENRVERIKKEESFILSSTGKTGHYSLHKKSAIVSSC